MQNVVIFWESLFEIIADFLLSEPIVYFVSIIILLCIVALLQRVFNISR